MSKECERMFIFVWITKNVQKNYRKVSRLLLNGAKKSKGETVDCKKIGETHYCWFNIFQNTNILELFIYTKPKSGILYFDKAL